MQSRKKGLELYFFEIAPFCSILQGIRTVCFRPAVQKFFRRAAKLTLLNVRVLIFAAYMYFAIITFSHIF
jgi:hypothetical protein